MTCTRSRLFSLAVAAFMAMPVIAFSAQSANADVSVRVRGKVKVRVGHPHRVRRVRVRHRRHRTAPPVVRLRVGGGVYWGGDVYVDHGYAVPPPPPGLCNCPRARVPAYYTAPPAPPAPPAQVVAARPGPPPLPRLAIGVFAGGIEIGERMEGEDVGVLARLRLTDSILIEGEIAKSDLDNERVDRRLGGALIYDLLPRSSWSLQLLAGAGVTQVELGDGEWRSDQGYGEVGAGLSYRLTRHIQLAADIRAGSRAPVDDRPAEKLRSIAPDADDREGYTRGRLSAILTF